MTEPLDGLADLEGAVITAVAVTGDRARIVASLEGRSIAVTLISCEWNDDRCLSCRCDKSRVRLVIE